MAAAARLNEMEVFPEAHEKGPRRARHWLHCAASGRANARNHSHSFLLLPRKCAWNGAGNEPHFRVRVAAASPPCADVPGAWPWDGRGVRTGQNREKENTFFNKNKIRCVKSCLQQLKCIVKILYMGTEEAGGGVYGWGVWHRSRFHPVFLVSGRKENPQQKFHAQKNKKKQIIIIIKITKSTDANHAAKP